MLQVPGSHKYKYHAVQVLYRYEVVRGTVHCTGTTLPRFRYQLVRGTGTSGSGLGTSQSKVPVPVAQVQVPSCQRSRYQWLRFRYQVFRGTGTSGSGLGTKLSEVPVPVAQVQIRYQVQSEVQETVWPTVSWWPRFIYRVVKGTITKMPGSGTQVQEPGSPGILYTVYTRYHVVIYRYKNNPVQVVRDTSSMQPRYSIHTRQ